MPSKQDRSTILERAAREMERAEQYLRLRDQPDPIDKSVADDIVRDANNMIRAEQGNFMATMQNGGVVTDPSGNTIYTRKFPQEIVEKLQKAGAKNLIAERNYIMHPDDKAHPLTEKEYQDTIKAIQEVLHDPETLAKLGNNQRRTLERYEQFVKDSHTYTTDELATPKMRAEIFNAAITEREVIGVGTRTGEIISRVVREEKEELREKIKSANPGISDEELTKEVKKQYQNDVYKKDIENERLRVALETEAPESRSRNNRAHSFSSWKNEETETEKALKAGEPLSEKYRKADQAKSGPEVSGRSTGETAPLAPQPETTPAGTNAPETPAAPHETPLTPEMMVNLFGQGIQGNPQMLALDEARNAHAHLGYCLTPGMGETLAENPEYNTSGIPREIYLNQEALDALKKNGVLPADKNFKEMLSDKGQQMAADSQRIQKVLMYAVRVHPDLDRHNRNLTDTGGVTLEQFRKAVDDSIKLWTPALNGPDERIREQAQALVKNMTEIRTKIDNFQKTLAEQKTQPQHTETPEVEGRGGDASPSVRAGSGASQSPSSHGPSTQSPPVKPPQKPPLPPRQGPPVKPTLPTKPAEQISSEAEQMLAGGRLAKYHFDAEGNAPDHSAVMVRSKAEAEQIEKDLKKVGIENVKTQALDDKGALFEVRVTGAADVTKLKAVVAEGEQFNTFNAKVEKSITAPNEATPEQIAKFKDINKVAADVVEKTRSMTPEQKAKYLSEYDPIKSKLGVATNTTLIAGALVDMAKTPGEVHVMPVVNLGLGSGGLAAEAVGAEGISQVLGAGGGALLLLKGGYDSYQQFREGNIAGGAVSATGAASGGAFTLAIAAKALGKLSLAEDLSGVGAGLGVVTGAASLALTAADTYNQYQITKSKDEANDQDRNARTRPGITRDFSAYGKETLPLKPRLSEYTNLQLLDQQTHGLLQKKLEEGGKEAAEKFINDIARPDDYNRLKAVRDEINSNLSQPFGGSALPSRLAGVQDQLLENRSEIEKQMEQSQAGQAALRELRGDFDNTGANKPRGFNERMDEYNRVMKPLEKDYGKQIERLEKLSDIYRESIDRISARQMTGLIPDDPASVAAQKSVRDELIGVNDQLKKAEKQLNADRELLERGIVTEHIKHPEGDKTFERPMTREEKDKAWKILNQEQEKVDGLHAKSQQLNIKSQELHDKFAAVDKKVDSERAYFNGVVAPDYDRKRADIQAAQEELAATRKQLVADTKKLEHGTEVTYTPPTPSPYGGNTLPNANGGWERPMTDQERQDLQAKIASEKDQAKALDEKTKNLQVAFEPEQKKATDYMLSRQLEKNTLAEKALVDGMSAAEKKAYFDHNKEFIEKAHLEGRKDIGLVGLSRSQEELDAKVNALPSHRQQHAEEITAQQKTELDKVNGANAALHKQLDALSPGGQHPDAPAVKQVIGKDGKPQFNDKGQPVTEPTTVKEIQESLNKHIESERQQVATLAEQAKKYGTDESKARLAEHQAVLGKWELESAKVEAQNLSYQAEIAKKELEHQKAKGQELTKPAEAEKLNKAQDEPTGKEHEKNDKHGAIHQVIGKNPHVHKALASFNLCLSKGTGAEPHDPAYNAIPNISQGSITPKHREV